MSSAMRALCTYSLRSQSNDNIIVKDGQMVSILDWEYAAFLPVWYEYVAASFGFTVMDVA